MAREWQAPDACFGPNWPFNDGEEWDEFRATTDEYDLFVIDNQSPDYHG